MAVRLLLAYDPVENIADVAAVSVWDQRSATAELVLVVEGPADRRILIELAAEPEEPEPTPEPEPEPDPEPDPDERPRYPLIRPRRKPERRVWPLKLHVEALEPGYYLVQYDQFILAVSNAILEENEVVEITPATLWQWGARPEPPDYPFRRAVR